jgi:uncharacterized protein
VIEIIFNQKGVFQMKKLLSALALLFVASTTCAAPPSEASIDELLRITKTDQIAEAVMVPMEQMMKQSVATSLQGKTVSAQERQSIDNFIPKALEVARNELAYANMRPMYLQIYQGTFTQEEVDGLIAFYKSPAGLAFTNKMPAVMQKTMILVQAKMQPMNLRIQAAMKQAIDEAKLAK